MALTAVRYTYDFVIANLPSGAALVLEVGCGDGALAALLKDDGLEVIAIDSDEEAVAAASAAGIDTRLAEWPAAVEGRFDAILFTRSLHHIHALDTAVAAAADALRPNGRIIVEDFRAEGGGARGARWFGELAQSLLVQQAVTASLDELLEKLEPGDHDLHSSTAIAAALGGLAVEASDAAYYFRYLEPHLRQPRLAQDLLEAELAAIAAGAIDPLGKRFVAATR